MILKYESSNGEVYDLKVKPIRTRSANFHEYNWKAQTLTLQYGDKVTRFDKPAQMYSALLDISGGIEERKASLNALHAAFDADIFSMLPGKIIHGDYYIHCFITHSNTYYKNPFTQNEINIYCPYPFWIKENVYDFAKVEDIQDANQFLDFPYDFSYDYRSELTGQAFIQNPGAAPANYRLIIYGAVNNPYIVADGNYIGINTVLENNEYAVIDSRNHTVYKVANNGTRTNLFNDRIKGNVSMFEKISSGDHFVAWSGLFGITLTIYEERSEPLWS